MPLPKPSVKKATHTMPFPKPPWCYVVSRWNFREIEVEGKKEFLPTLQVLVYDHGLNGTTLAEHGDPRNLADWDTVKADETASRKHLTAIPHDFIWKSKGKEHEGYMLEEPWKAKSIDGTPGVYFPSVFEQVKEVHGRIKITHDQPLFLDFLRAVATWLGPLSEEQKEMARENTPSLKK